MAEGLPPPGDGVGDYSKPECGLRTRSEPRARRSRATTAMFFWRDGLLPVRAGLSRRALRSGGSPSLQEAARA